MAHSRSMEASQPSAVHEPFCLLRLGFTTPLLAQRFCSARMRAGSGMVGFDAMNASTAASRRCSANVVASQLLRFAGGVLERKGCQRRGIFWLPERLQKRTRCLAERLQKRTRSARVPALQERPFCWH